MSSGGVRSITTRSGYTFKPVSKRAPWKAGELVSVESAREQGRCDCAGCPCCWGDETGGACGIVRDTTGAKCSSCSPYERPGRRG